MYLALSMPQITDILSNFTDTELAYLYKFRLASYLPATQEKMKEYIFRGRGLDENRLDELIASHPPQNSRFREFQKDAKDFFSDLLDGIGDCD